MYLLLLKNTYIKNSILQALLANILILTSQEITEIADEVKQNSNQVSKN